MVALMLYYTVLCTVKYKLNVLEGLIQALGSLKMVTNSINKSSHTYKCVWLLNYDFCYCMHLIKTAKTCFLVGTRFFIWSKVSLKISTFSLRNLVTFIFFLITKLVYSHFQLFGKQNIEFLSHF